MQALQATNGMMFLVARYYVCHARIDRKNSYLALDPALSMIKSKEIFLKFLSYFPLKNRTKYSDWRKYLFPCDFGQFLLDLYLLSTMCSCIICWWNGYVPTSLLYFHFSSTCNVSKLFLLLNIGTEIVSCDDDRHAHSIARSNRSQ